MRKRIWAAVVCLCMVFTLLPGTARAATSGTCGANLTWTLENGVLTISGSGAMRNYSYNSWYEDGSSVPTYVIDAPWYDVRESIKEVIIDSGVTSIGSYSFGFCSMLNKVTISSTVKTIQTGAFFCCRSLTRIEIPDGVTIINADTFDGCNSLTHVDIPDSVTRISGQAFADCKSLTSVNLPKNLNYIGKAAFVSAGLTSIELPKSLTAVSEYAFDRCRDLKDISIPDSITTIEGGAFSYCTSLTSVIIPDSVRTIGSGAFSSCTSLMAVTISDGVENIERAAFGNCNSLTEIFVPSSVTSIGEYAFAGSQVREILVDNNNPRYRSIDGALYTKDLSTLVMCPEGKTGRLVIPEGVTTFESGEHIGPLYNCQKLTGLTIPSSVTTTGFVKITEIYGEPRRDAWGTFPNCPGLTSAGPIGSGCDIEFGWTSTIPDATFEHATALKTVILPEGLTDLDYTFSGCSSLETVYIPDSIKTIGKEAFYGCTSLSTLVIPDGVTSIGRHAFEGCTSLTSLTIPKSVTDIDPYGLEWGRDCPDLTIYCYKDSAAHQYARQFGIQFELLDDDSQPSAISIQSVALTKNGMTTNLLTQTAEFELGSSEMAAVSANVNWDSENNGRTFLIQDKDTYVELPTSFTPGTVFNSDDPVYVIATNAAADTLLDWKEIKLQIVRSTPPTAPQISITPETLELSIGKTEDITVTTTPAGAKYTLTSNDPEVVSVAGNTLTARKLGRAEITAALVDHPGVTAVCSVAVKDGYDDLMCAIAACQLSYENELTRYAFGAKVSTFTDVAIGPNRLLWNGYTDATLSDFYKDVLGDWEIVDVVSKSSGLFAVALDNPDTNQRIIAYRGTEANTWADLSADAQLAVLNKLSPQFGEAMDFYTKNSTGNKNILLTGHSLGGALACYVSLQTGERAELFNGANGLIIEDSYFIGGEEIYNHFHGANRWNFTNHVTDVATVSVNYPIAYPNAGKLPVEVHEPSSLCSSASLMGLDGHSLLSMLEYDESTARFRLTDGTPYSQTLSDVREFEMTRVDALYFMRKAIDVYQLVKNPAEFILEQLIFSVSGLQGYLEEHVGAYEKVFFSFGSSGDDTIAIQKIIEQVFLFGGDGNDFLTGGCINDVLVGGLGTNAMDGGPMNDLYVITGTSDQYINDCSGVDDIYIPSGVRVSSYGNPTDKVDGYYVLTLTNGQRIMINENRKQGSDNRFRVYSMDGTYCGSYQTVPQETEAQMMALAVEEETVETSETLPVTTLEFSGKNLVLNVQDSAGNTVGTVDTTSDTFPLYRPYGYFYYDSQDETLRAHLFGGTGEVQVSSTSQAEQTVECAYIFHAASDDLPLKRFTANIAVGSSDTILTPSCSVQEPAVPFRLMDGNGDIQNIPVKTEDLTVSETPSTPDQPTESPNQLGGSTDTPPSNSSGGGGSSSSNSYSISTPTRVTGGTIQVSPSSAQKGATVTITVTPNSGYELDRLTVTDSRGNEIKLTAQGGGKYTFTMPGRAVTVKAAFAPLPDDTEKPCDGGADCPSHGFTDLGTVGTWYHEAVDYVLRNNLMDGYGSGLFGPNDTLTRAQFAQILYNKEGRPAVTGGSSFTDVAPGAWCAPAITWAAERGIVGGYENGMFGPNDSITREQLAVMLWRYAGSPAATDKELHFTDADKASGYALEALRWAVENGVMGGYGNGQLAPQGLATRAQAAQMLKNYLER